MLFPEVRVHTDKRTFILPSRVLDEVSRRFILLLFFLGIYIVTSLLLVSPVKLHDLVAKRRVEARFL